MTTRVAAALISAIVAVPSAASALTVDDFSRMINSPDADTEHGKGRDVAVLNVSSRFAYEKGATITGVRPTGRHRALGFFRETSRNAVTAVKNRVVPKIGIWDLRKIASKMPIQKKPQPKLIAAGPKVGPPIAGGSGRNVQIGRSKGNLARKATQFSDPGKELMRRLNGDANARQRARNRAQSGGFKGRR